MNQKFKKEKEKKEELNLSEQMLKFLDYQAVACKASTINHYKTALRHLHRFLQLTFKTDKIKKTHIAKLTKAHLQDFLIYLNGQSLVAYSKVNYFLNIRFYLAWEAEQERFNPDILKIFDRKHLPKVPEYLPRPMSAQTDQQLITLLKAAKSPYACLFLLLRFTGLRISELISLPWDCVITNDKNEKYLKVPPGKMDLERLVPLSNESIKLIEKIKDIYPIKLNKCRKDRLIGLMGNSSAVRQNLAGEFKNMIGELNDQNKPITFHRLRHTYATSLLTAGVSILSIMKLLGHRRIEMSLRYAKVTPSHLRNEYLKAIKIIETQIGFECPSEQKNTDSHFNIHPAEIINQLHAFARKDENISDKQKRTLLQRLQRLKTDIEQINFKHDFKISPLNLYLPV